MTPHERTYRLLNHGEVIQDGDEVFILSQQAWGPVTRPGMEVQRWWSPVRRATDAAPLAALAMREAAMNVVDRVYATSKTIDKASTAEITDGLRALPLPDEAALTAAALTLPKVKAMREAAEWQPIDTVPKDGTAVLLLFAMRAAEYAKWSDEKLEPYRLQALSVEVGFFQGGEWCEAGTGHDFFEEWRRSDYPTHWMPLPATPDTAPPPASKGPSQEAIAASHGWSDADA